MSEVKALFESTGFHSRMHETYFRLIKHNTDEGFENTEAWLKGNGWNTHVVGCQITVWNKASRSNLCARIVVDMHGQQWDGLERTAKAVHTSQFYKAYFFDETHARMLKEAMDNDPTIVDQGSEEALRGRLA